MINCSTVVYFCRRVKCVVIMSFFVFFVCVPVQVFCFCVEYI